MDNYEYTASYDEEKLFKEYDSIIGTTLINLFSLSKETNDIIFNEFNYKSKLHRVFLESALLLGSLHKKKIGLHMPFISYIYFKYIIMRKRKDSIYRIKDKHEKGIDIKRVATYEADGYNHSIFVFDDIYNAYYRKIYEGR